MKKSYLTNYLKIYFWRVFSVILNFISIFIVVPRISSDPAIYGVYMVCISTAIFLSYADIGFIGAGYKYCAECFARKDFKSEVEIQGFVSFVLAIFISVFVIFYLSISFNPSLLIKDMSNSVENAIASKLLFIQAIFSYTIVFQRLNNNIFGIRLENYKFQKIQIVGHTIKIFSVFYFFQSDHYDVVGYFLFSKTIELAAVLLGLFIAKRLYGYSLFNLLMAFKFSRKVFQKTKNLALASFYVTVMWILYYELDSIVISKLLGAEAVACFAIGLTISKFFRNLSKIVFSPFIARFNHFVGNNELKRLNRFYLVVIKRTMPLIVIPVICMLVLMKPLILSWVGVDYTASIKIALFLIFSNIFMFISVPTKALITSLEKIKLLYIINSLMVIVYWGGIFLTIDKWQLESFAIFKFVALMVGGIFYLFIAMRFLKINIFLFFKKIILQIVCPVLFLIVSLFIIQPYLPIEKGKINLLIVVFTGGCISVLSMILYYLMSKDFRNFINGVLEKLNLRSIPKSRAEV